MPPKFKKLNPEDFNNSRTLNPGNNYSNNYNNNKHNNPSGGGYNNGLNGVYQNGTHYQGAYQGQKFAGSGYSTPNTGTSTPVDISGASSTVSLTSLSSALKDIQKSPVSEDLESILSAKTLSDIRSSAGTIAEVLFKDGAHMIEEYFVFDHLQQLSKVKASPLIREGSALVLSTICRKFGMYTPAEAYILPCITVALDLFADKENSVKRAAQSCIDAVYAVYPDEAKVSALWSKLLEYLGTSAKWQSKIAALKLIEKIVESVPQDYLDARFVDSIPVLTSVMHDMKPELSKQATKTLTEFANKVDNQDIVPRIPIIIQTISDPKNVQECIKTFSRVTFVAEVTESALSILVPILNRALNLTSTSQDSLRQTVIVVENLTRLVHNPREVKRFIPELLPGVKKVVETAAQPEVRELAAKALKVLQEAESDLNAPKTKINQEEAKRQVSDDIKYTLSVYVSQLIVTDVNTREFKKLKDAYKNYLQVSDEAAAEKVDYFKALFVDSAQEDTSEEGIEIVKTEFSLAYGGRMLLNKALLRLFKGRRYGLCGRNGVGKSTLMRAIAEGKLEGFPNKDQVRTCFVEHRLQAEEGDLDVVRFILSDPQLLHLQRSEVSKALEEVGFHLDRQQVKVGSLSGGWKMKLELARAILMNADILLLDEPTNHLDVANVKWLEDYLVTHTDITSLIVSHDSGFLDAVCTDIIHYESKKLVYYKGNLSE